eukprot:CAMPEP_0178949678 /NCGR_PEP_ID=MMETSP0789-20121207/6199_1 /TAXON_ID=3005 /ORGANISM="Rhizosolenia setigera, Strain CCMP 1694" /LENGTH=199 /DNA_ID=CAMNT_0020630257 /DNA_START=80 /DNA_END=679 /DNA_ORIENTATION=-
MKTAAVLSLLASTAAAFAPAKMAASKSALNMASEFENELGVIAPTGFWDPAKLSSGISQEKFDYYRTLEVKHGRVCMLAILGYVAPETYRFGFDIAPGLPCAEVPNGIAALDSIPVLGWVQIIWAVGAVELYGFLGDFEVGKLDLDDEILEERKLQEIQHGRIAMLGFLELIRHDSQNLVTPGFDGLDNLITGLPFIYN